MLFQFTFGKVLSGDKTMTRRVVRNGERLSDDGLAVLYPNGRVKWKVGRTYAVQPARGKNAVGRIRITTIRQEQLRDITDHDIECEGIAKRTFPVKEALTTLYGEPLQNFVTYDWRFAELWDAINRKPGMRWVDNSLVWVLTFERRQNE